MIDKDIVPSDRQVSLTESAVVPQLIELAGPKAKRRFVEFFLASIENDGTRKEYMHAVRLFCDWCDGNGVSLEMMEPTRIALYIKTLRTDANPRGTPYADVTVKQHLAAIRMLFDYLVTGGVLPYNPAASVRGPKVVITRGKTPVLPVEDVRAIFEAIDTTKISGIRDRALIGVLVHAFARIGAVLAMNVEDYYRLGHRGWIRLHEKGGKFHEMPLHHNAEAYLDAYVMAAGIGDEKGSPLFRTLDRHRALTTTRLQPHEAWKMIKRRARRAGVSSTTCCHSFRATGLTEYMRNGGTLERAAQMAAHSSTRTTKLYTRHEDPVTLDEVERVVI